ncbi:MAG: type II secretion system protein GspH, partial [Comamonadaceae bacterium]
VSIIAIASAGVAFALRDSSQSALEREGVRLAALLESARAQSRASGVPVRWQATAGGFRFDGLPPAALPSEWLDAAAVVADGTLLVLGPEPLIGAQAVVLMSTGQPQASLRVSTDGLRPFTVQTVQTGVAAP